MLCFLGFLWQSLAEAQNLNISLVSSFKPTQASSGYGDVWGDGNLAFMGSWTAYATFGVGIFDISNPSSPNLLTIYNFTNTTGNQFEQGVLRSNILYIGAWGNGNNGGSGVHILSVTNPSAPVLLSRISSSRSGTVLNGFNDVHTLFLERNFLYLAAHESSGILSVKVFDVSNPSAPVYVTDVVTTNTTKVHQITTGMKGTNTILYTSGWGVSGSSLGQTDIWDVSAVKTQGAKWLGRIYSGYSSHSSWPTSDGNTLIVCRETTGGEVSFYDISTPPNPSSSSGRNPTPFFVISPASMGIEADVPHNPVVVGNLLFVSWYQNGIQIFDITDRTKPVRIGCYDTYAPAPTTTFQGNWGIYPHLGLNKLLLSDINNGFFIMDASAVLTATNNYPPLLIKSPITQTVTQGATTTFDAVVTGSSMNYRWYFNGTPIAGATASTLVITNTQTADAGSYSFVASNILNSVTRAVTSSVATLSVSLPTNGPVITSQPQNTSVYAEQTATFSVGVIGTAPFSYQWRFNGTDIPNGTNNVLVLNNVFGDAVGNYSVLVADAISSVLSSNASLTIIDSPYINSVQAAPGAKGAIISWKTTVPSDSQVQFDPASASGQQLMAAFSSAATFSQASYTDTTLTTNHSILLTGLSPATTYNFQVVSSSDTNSYISGAYSFTTAGAEIILDNTSSDVAYTGNWSTGTSSTDKYGGDYRFVTSSGVANSNATFRPKLPISGLYEVSVWYPQGGNRATNSPFFVSYNGSSITVRLNQQTNGGKWVSIGQYPFAAGTTGFVRVSNQASGGSVVLVDAVRFTYATAQDLPIDGSMPAWWANYYFGNTTTNPNADADGDGYSNGQEYILGTSPILANQKLGVNVFRSGNSANVIFSPYLGDRNYTLLHSSDLSPIWAPASTGAIIPDSYGEGVFTLSVTNEGHDFYRLAVQLNSGGAARGTTASYTGSVTLTEDTALSPYATDPVCGPNRAYVVSRRR